jgi:hypothetical protein
VRICPKCGEDDRTQLVQGHEYACDFCGNRWIDGLNPPEPTYARALVLKGDAVVLRGSRAELQRLQLALVAALAGGTASCGNVSVETIEAKGRIASVA